jgi:uncharacterized SAM-binding protein YcdF (DUF218 family)
MDYALAKIVGLIASLGTILLVALFLGCALLWHARSRQMGRIVVTIVALGFAVIALTPLQPLLTGLLEDRFKPHPELPAKIDGIIILGGMIRPEVSAARGQPSLNDAAERLWAGAQLARLHPEAKLVFSGGSADPFDSSAKESIFALQALEAMGLSGDRIVIEDQSRNTYENALYSRKIANPEPGQTWILVTSALHMPRAALVFAHQNWPMIPWPVNFLTGGRVDWVNEDIALQRLYLFSRTLHEYVGLVYYRLRGWTGGLSP